MRISGYSSGITLPETIKSGKTDLTAAVSKSSSNGMTDEYIEKIKAYAQEDAKAGVYMQEGYVALSKAQKTKYVSPDRQRAISQVSLMMNSRRTWNYGQNILSLFGFGLPYTANVFSGATRTTAEIFDQNGEMIAGYHSDNGYWTEVPTKAETNFMYESAQIYREAYRAARAEMKAAAGGQVSASATVTEGSFSVTV